jgi:TonB family protein
MQFEPEPVAEAIAELPPHSRLPRLDLGVDWGSPWEEFRSSWQDYFQGPKLPADTSLPEDADLKIEWVEGKLSKRGYAVSAAWHIVAVILICLPIWGFLAIKPVPYNGPEIQLSWTPPTNELPTIAPRGFEPKPSPKGDPSKPLPQKGADALSPRQTIVSQPIQANHPRQTLIRPDAPLTPPKIDPQMPNVVEWAAAAAEPVPQLHITPTVAAAKIQRRTVTDLSAPEIANQEKNPGALNIAAAPLVNQEPKMPVSAMSAAVRQKAQTETGAAPEIGAASAGDASLHRVIALSAAPAPPAPEVNVPQGNLSSRLAISPDGKQPGSPSGAEHGVASNGGSGGNTTSPGGTGKNGGGNARNLPAGVSIRGGDSRNGNGGVGPSGGGTSSKLNLKPMPSADAMPGAHKSSPTIAAIAPGMAPEKVLSGNEIFTVHIDMPNLTSYSGSWIMKFAELEDGGPPYLKKNGTLSGPAPERKVDPKYPQSLIKERVDGQVVLYAIIRKDGTVDSIQVVRGLDPALDQNSMAALARWQFRPAMRDGNPVDVEAVVFIPFRFHPTE